MEILVNPLEQLIIWDDPTYKDTHIVLDQLTKDWDHKKEIQSSPYDTLEKSFAWYANQEIKIGRKKFPKGGWVKLKLDSLQNFSDIAKPSMEKLGNKDLFYGSK